MSDRLLIRLLGPLEILVGDRALSPGGPRVRALLAYLVLHGEHAVPAERLLDDLWGPDADDGARHSLHTHVSTLRRHLASAGAGVSVERDEAGYRLEAPGAWVDVVEFTRLSGLALSQDDAGVAREALALWQTGSEPHLWDEPWARPVLEDLRERRMLLTLLHLDAQLADGRHAEIIPELQELTEAHPFAEPLWERRIIALYRAGRQVDALDAYRELESMLREELGVEPGPDLQRVHRQVLLHDRALLHRGAAPHAVPGTLTTFVGRDAELGWLISLLRDHRLVTVLGSGGVGKTRIVVELAHRERGNWRGGIWFVDLAPLRDGGRIAENIAALMEIPSPPGGELDGIAARVADGETLLVLDNCEHLRADVARAVAGLLDRAPGLSVIVTSRVGLGLTGEVTWVLPPLEVPDDGEAPGGVAERDAVRLFVDRATAVRPAFRLGPSNIATVGALCRRLDGLPLALELAATRLRSMGVSEIAGYLESDLDFLRSTDPTLDDRHRTLTGVLDWSIRLLDRATVRVHAHLSILPGSFGIDLAAAVTDLSEAEVADHLDTLVAHSLLTADTNDRSTRYRMLEVVRDHASLIHDREGLRPETEPRLLEWALRTTVLEALDPDSADRPAGLHLFSGDWVRHLAMEQHNLRAALAAAHHDPTNGLRLATRLTRYWWVSVGRSHGGDRSGLPAVSEGISWLERILALPGADPGRRDAARVALGFLRGVSGDRETALAELLDVRDRLDERGSARRAGWASMYAGTASWGLVPLEGTRQLYTDARERFSASGEFEGAIMLYAKELTLALTHQPDRVPDVVEELLSFTQGASSPSVSAYRALVQAIDASHQRDPGRARGMLRRVHDLLPPAGDAVTTTLVLSTSAWWAALAGHHRAAADLARVSAAVETRNGLDLTFAHVLRDRALQELPPEARPSSLDDPDQPWNDTSVSEAFSRVRTLLRDETSALEVR